MDPSLSVLIVEDSEDDALLVAQELRRSGFVVEFDRVETRDAMLAALARYPWDLVIADYSLPHFSGPDALALVRHAGLDVPVIIVSGAIGEDVAVAAMKAGAQDYVMKGNLARLGPAVERELREAADRRERRKAESTLRKTERELDEAQRDLVQSEKMAALGRFSSGLAHEMKNPLGIILGGVEFLETKLAGTDASSKTALDKVKDAALRAADIVDQMLKFAKPSELKLEETDPARLMDEAVSLFRYGITSRNVRIVTEYPPEAVRIRVDRNQMQQVIFNLLSNAVDAMPGGGQVTVRVSRVPHAKHVSGWARCVIEVADEGVGISREHLARIFEPFFTTKRDQKGTGLGLSIARTIVEHHHGILKIESEAGKGTQARILLPLASEEAQA